MYLEDFGYTEKLEKFRIQNNLDINEIGRVIAEHKERYIVKTTQGEFESEITGNLRYSARNREDFPAVGDWVQIITYNADFAIIQKVLPRFSVIKRQAVGMYGEVQLIAANIDFSFIVQAVDRDFNINRLERYLTISNESNIKPIIVLTKIDLIEELYLNEIIESIKHRIKNIPIVAISSETLIGYDTLQSFIEKGKTYCLLGSSGVGKSTLSNSLCGKQIMKTDVISKSTNKGKHVTSHRELILIPNGGVLIDNPGMREVGIADTSSGLETTFDIISNLSKNCKFIDCQHINESGCAVTDAVEKGKIDRSSYDNFLKLQREKAHYESTVFEKRKKEKSFGKLMKNYKKDIHRNK